MAIKEKPVYVGGVGTVYQDGVALPGTHVQYKDALEHGNEAKLLNPASAVEVRFDPVRVELQELVVADPAPAPAPVPAPVHEPLFRLNQQTLATFFPYFRGPDNGTNKWEAEWGVGDVLRYYRWANVNGSDRSGFTFDPNILLPVPYASLADSLFVLKFRINVVQGLGDSQTNEGGMKWFIFGGPGLQEPGGGIKRMIFWFRSGLWFDPNTGVVVAGSANETTLHMSQGVGAGVKCRITNGVDHEVKIVWKYGADAFMAIYVDNNDFANPNARFDVPGWTFPESWAGGHWGNIETDNSISNQTGIFEIWDAQFDNVFDGNW